METLVEQQRSALHRAWWVAMSGKFDDWQAVCRELEQRGHERPQRWFRGEDIRARMNAVCVASRDAVPQPETDPIWQVLQREHIANWMRDFETFAQCHAGTDYERWWARVGGNGVTQHNGRQDVSRAMRSDIRNDPDVCPYLAYLTRFEDRSLRVSDTLAWATFDVVFPTDDLPYWRGPGLGHVQFVLEKLGSDWKIIGFIALDDQFAQSEAPTWQVDRTGRVLMQNPAAKRRPPAAEGIVMRAGRLHLTEARADTALSEALLRLDAMDWGIMEVGHAEPIVNDPGDDTPVTIWWAGRRGGRLYVSTDDTELLAGRLEIASRALGLSPSQHRLAIAIIQGMTLPEAAKQEGVRLSTARTQLQRIFDKVGVRGQPALVRSLLSIAAAA